MKAFRVTLQFSVATHVTKEFIEEYFERMMKEKVHNPVSVEVEEVESDFSDDEKL